MLYLLLAAITSIYGLSISLVAYFIQSITKNDYLFKLKFVFNFLTALMSGFMAISGINIVILIISAKEYNNSFISTWTIAWFYFRIFQLCETVLHLLTRHEITKLHLIHHLSMLFTSWLWWQTSAEIGFYCLVIGIINAMDNSILYSKYVFTDNSLSFSSYLSAVDGKACLNCTSRVQSLSSSISETPEPAPLFSTLGDSFPLPSVVKVSSSSMNSHCRSGDRYATNTDLFWRRLSLVSAQVETIVGTCVTVAWLGYFLCHDYCSRIQYSAGIPCMGMSNHIDTVSEAAFSLTNGCRGWKTVATTAVVHGSIGIWRNLRRAGKRQGTLSLKQA